MGWSSEHPLEIIAAAPDPIVIVAPEGHIDFANDQVQAAFGYPPTELAGVHIGTLVPAVLPGLLSELRREGARAKPRTGVRSEARHKSGHPVPVEMFCAPVGDGDGRQFVCIIRDISERLKLEEQLRRSLEDAAHRAAASEESARRTNEHFKMFLKHAPAAIAMLDTQMRYLIVSDRWLQDFGVEKRDIHGLSHYEVFPEIPDRWKEMHRRCLAGEVMKSDEDSFVRMDGRREWLRWEIRPWRTAHGRIGGIMLFSEIITPHKEAQIELMRSHQELEVRVAERTGALEAMKTDADRANDMKSWFVAAASHDLRQPLQAALAYLATLSRKSGGGELADLSERVRQPLIAMKDILDILLDISNLESGRVTPNLADFDLDGTVARILAGVRHLADGKGLRLSHKPAGLCINSDPRLLERVIINFVTNAIRYTEKGEVAVECCRKGSVARLSVRDTGVGIPAAALGTIFEDYVQLDNPARDRRKGLGLGLSIAKRIADCLGHPITVQSELGRGSTFTIELPLASRATNAANDACACERATAPSPAEEAVILVIDDDADVAESLRMLLQSYDFQVRVALDGDAAVAHVAGGLRPDVIVCDYRLQEEVGPEVVRRVRQAAGTETPTVMLTGDTSIRECPNRSHACTILHKPVDFDRLLALIENLTRKAA